MWQVLAQLKKVTKEARIAGAEVQEGSLVVNPVSKADLEALLLCNAPAAETVALAIKQYRANSQVKQDECEEEMEQGDQSVQYPDEYAIVNKLKESKLVAALEPLWHDVAKEVQKQSNELAKKVQDAVDSAVDSATHSSDGGVTLDAQGLDGAIAKVEAVAETLSRAPEEMDMICHPVMSSSSAEDFGSLVEQRRAELHAHAKQMDSMVKNLEEGQTLMRYGVFDRTMFMISLGVALAWVVASCWLLPSKGLDMIQNTTLAIQCQAQAHTHLVTARLVNELYDTTQRNADMFSSGVLEWDGSRTCTNGAGNCVSVYAVATSSCACSFLMSIVVAE